METQKELLKVSRNDVCRNLLLKKKCDRESCKYIHDTNICFHHWKFDKCKFGNQCSKKHLNYIDNIKINTKENTSNQNDQLQKNNKNRDKYNRKKIKKNTETFEPIKKIYDVRITMDLGTEKLTSSLTERDILLVPNLFSDFKSNEIYTSLINELNQCDIPKEKLFKLWHGDTHLIADDKLKYNNTNSWKEQIPTFNMVINRIKTFFNMDIKATRLNFYEDTSQWKPFHFDAAAVKPDKADKQNFTVGVSFGKCRSAAFERDTNDKTVISIPIDDGHIYAFCKQTNILWRHGILQELPCVNEGRISIIAWGWVDNMLCLE
jgi:hypothetical protein